MILRSPKLQIGLAIQWMHTHFHELNNSFVQNMRLKVLFFSSDALKPALLNRPQVQDELRALIENHFSHYGNTYEYFSQAYF